HGGGWIEKDTKTHQSRRISRDAATVLVLDGHRQSVARRASLAGMTRLDDDFVFSAAVDGSVPWLPNHQTQRFKTLCQRVGVEGVRLHDLRHMHATQL